MAKIGSEVNPEVKERFKLLRMLGFNKKKEPVKTKTEEEKIQEIATNAYKTADFDAIQRSFEIGVEEARKKNDANPTEENKKALEEAEKALEIFNNTVEKLKLADLETERKLYTAAKNSEKVVNDLVTEFEKNITTFLDAIKKGELPNISTMISVITDNRKNYLTNINSFEEKVNAYNKFMGKEAYKVTHKKMYMTEDQLEEIYRGIKTILNDMTEKKGKNAGFINNIKYKNNYQKFLNGLSAYAEDKDKYKEMVARVDKELSEQKINPADKEKAEAQSKIDALLAEMLEKDKQQIKEHKGLTSISVIGDKVDEITKDYSALSSKEKEELKEEAKNKYKDMINKEFSNELFEAINVVHELEAMIITLQSTDYTSPDFRVRYDEIKAFIKNPAKKAVLDKAKVKISLDETELKIYVLFGNPKVIDDRTLDIVEEKDKAKVRDILKNPDPDMERLKEARAILSAELVKLLGQDPKTLTAEKVKNTFEELLNTAFSDLSEEKRNGLVTEFVSKYDQQVKKATPEEKITGILEALFEKFKNDFKKCEIKIRTLDLSVDVCTVLDEFNLTAEEKQAYITKAKADFEKMKEKEFGRVLIDVVEEIIKIKNDIAELDSIEYTDPAFKPKYEKMLAKIKAIKELQMVKDLGINVELNEEEKTLSVLFNNPKIDNVKLDLVNQKTKDQMKAQKPPVRTEEDSEKEKKEAIEGYLRLLEELNSDIKELNKCNASIEAAASISMDTIDSSKINDVIAKEKVALGFDSNILNKRLELSNARAELRFKYNIYVTSIKEIKEAKTEKITFGKDYQEFVRYYDEMIVIAETKIKELNVERMSEHTPDSRAAELSVQMKELVNYIEAVNSLINRRMVAASLENDIDIVNFLQTRRENKKAIREEIKQMLEAERIKKAPINEEEEERQLEEKLNQVYEKWLNELRLAMNSNTIIVNEESYTNEIKHITDESKATRKYEIADKLSRDFIAKRAAIITQKDEQDLRKSVADLFSSEILTVIESIRLGADYTTNFEGLCINQSLAQRIETLINGSSIDNKTTILEEEKQNYLSKIKEIITKEKIVEQRNMLADIGKHISDIEKLEIDDQLETTIAAKFDTLIPKYNAVFGKVEVKYDIENNHVSIKFPCSKFNGMTYVTEIKSYDRQIMTDVMHDKYIQMKQRKPEPEITDQELLNAVKILMSFSNTQKHFAIQVLALEYAPEDKCEKILKELEKRGVIAINTDGTITKLMSSYEEYTAKYHRINSIISPKVETEEPKILPNDIRVNNGKALQFKSNNPQLISRLNGKILTGDEITISMVKNGLKIKYSENLREQLKALNARLSLVKKDDYRRRTTRQVEADKEEQIIAFKKESKDGFVPKDYKLQIRTDKLDSNGQKTRGTDLLYEMEIDQELSDEIVKTMGR